MEKLEKKYILVTYHNGNHIILMNNQTALEWIVENSYEIETLEFVDIIIPMQ
jgi:hypothetical protein